MDRRHKLSIASTVALLAAGAALTFLWQPAAQPAREAPARFDDAVLEPCLRAAELLYLITWAAACSKTEDDSNDCTLPDSRAAPINAALNADQAQCRSAALQR